MVQKARGGRQGSHRSVATFVHANQDAGRVQTDNKEASVGIKQGQARPKTTPRSSKNTWRRWDERASHYPALGQRITPREYATVSQPLGVHHCPVGCEIPTGRQCRHQRHHLSAKLQQRKLFAAVCRDGFDASSRGASNARERFSRATDVGNRAQPAAAPAPRFVRRQSGLGHVGNVASKRSHAGYDAHVRRVDECLAKKRPSEQPKSEIQLMLSFIISLDRFRCKATRFYCIKSSQLGSRDVSFTFVLNHSPATRRRA